ncbi:L-2-hydroxyglutarate oxidase [Algibacillus agarilyticus]|uniref:L-2-hydroxyglutarate oxidase n=1 Tax=Algibacillus agarilyticus TaxID=2234133 RepID=UPI000DD08F34|nr:L-2-hydroxyglutarate oxidase [Algibacillus agarilyticus]
MPNSHLLDADILIIGGGIVGAATALKLKQTYPQYSVMLLEKESQVAKHQTGRNSGVIHAGVYYPPESLKAQFCRAGLKAIKAFCIEHHIKFDECGKLIVATTELELTRLEALATRCAENKLHYQWLNTQELHKAEPNITGLAAILIEETSIVDYKEITQCMMDDFVDWGGSYWLDCKVNNIYETSQGVELDTTQGRFKTKYLICCAGIMADKLAKLAGIEVDFQMLPFRGEYYRLNSQHNNIVKHLIYPVPDPELPFLGIHLTKMIDGSVTVGPNAILGWKREGYNKFNFSWADSKEIIQFSGFWRILKHNYKHAFNELINSLSKSQYLRQVKKYCPSLKKSDLTPYPVGIRAQAVSFKGELIHDFLFKKTTRTLHVCNAPSPAATSSMPIAEHVVSQLEDLIKINEETNI